MFHQLSLPRSDFRHEQNKEVSTKKSGVPEERCEPPTTADSNCCGAPFRAVRARAQFSSSEVQGVGALLQCEMQHAVGRLPSFSIKLGQPRKGRKGGTVTENDRGCHGVRHRPTLAA